VHCCFTSHKHFISRPAGLIMCSISYALCLNRFTFIQFFFMFTLVSFRMSGTVVMVECQSDIFSTMFLYIEDYINSSSHINYNLSS